MLTRKVLSSAQTVLSKFVLPALWIPLFGFGALVMWFGGMTDGNGSRSPSAERWLFLALWIIGSVFILSVSARLKRVSIDERALYVSNYRKEIAVPLSAIASVTENRWINGHPVTVTFRSPTEFGIQITSLPKLRILGFWSSHPVVAELREAALTGSSHRA